MRVKGSLFTAWPLTVTENGPDDASGGTIATMLVSPQLMAVVLVPLSEIVLLLCVTPNPVPVIATSVPTAPVVGEMLVMLSISTTVKATPLLEAPKTVTTTFPVVAPVGTVTAMLVALQFVAVAAVPLNVTVLFPCVGPKFMPVIVTGAPTAPDVTDKLVMLGVESTVKFTPFVFTPLAFTTTFPVVAPVGTVTAMLVALHVPTVAVVPLNVTVLLPWVAPKFDPVIVTAAPTAPDVTDRLVMLGVGSTVKLTPFVFTPLAFTTTFPVVAPVGTGTAMLVALHVPTVAAVPLKLTVPVPCEEPKFDPVIVTAAPTAPDVTDRLVMLGVGRTVKFTPLLAWLDTVTTTFPVVAPLGTVAVMLDAPHTVAVADVPLNLTVLLPCEEPNVVPVIVTDAPTAPDVGARLLMYGVTVKLFPLLATPETVTTTFPVVAALGTVTLMLVDPHVVTEAVVPLNFTVLLPCVEPKFVPVIVTEVPTGPEVTDRLVMEGAAA